MHTDRVFQQGHDWGYGTLSLVIAAAIVQFGAYWFSLEAWGRHRVALTSSEP